MFKKRSFQVKYVKDRDVKDEETLAQDTNVFADKIHIINKVMKDNVRDAVLLGLGCVIVYVAADTARQCAVEYVKK